MPHSQQSTGNAWPRRSSLAPRGKPCLVTARCCTAKCWLPPWRINGFACSSRAWDSGILHAETILEREFEGLF